MAARPKSRTSNLLIQSRESELLVYDLLNFKAYCLNQFSARVWKSCDGNNSVEEIVAILGNQSKSSPDSELVWLALSQLHDNGLLENGSAIESRFNGQSRRQVIRRVGLTAAASLPVVFSIVAPKAISAQSCVIPGGAAPGTDIGCFSAFLPGCGATADSLCCSGSASRGTPPGPCTGMTAPCFCD